jgi:uncharacterized protein
MLVEFSVANFRSIKERQTFSMVADKPHKEHRCVLKTNFTAAPQLVESAAVYGPNGSGKSNFILAIKFFNWFVINSSKNKQEGEEIEIDPFLFSNSTQKQPSEFEIVFIHKGYLFQYGFTVNRSKVLKEWLYATPKSSQKQTPQKWYERSEKNHKVDSFIRKELKGAKETWKKSTRDNALFLSTAAQLESEDFQIPLQWFQGPLRILTSPESLSPGYTVSKLEENKKSYKQIIKFMKGLDASFDDITVIEKEVTEEDFKDVPEEIKSHVLKELKGKKRYDLFSIYRFGKEEYMLPFHKESEGTKRLLAYAGPILDVLNNGGILIADELHRSLHPLALKGILSLFQNNKVNTNNAQLVFTTHNTNSMNDMDRDQIWLIDKNKEGQSIITAISDFKGRNDEAIEKRYLTGRYGALPSIGELF